MKIFESVSVRKGTPIDIVLLPVVLLLFAVATYVSGQGILNYRNATYDSSSNVTKQILDTQAGNIPVLNNLFLFFSVGFGLIILAGSILLRTHPIFAIIGILIMIIGIIISAPISNAFAQYANDSSYTPGVHTSFTFPNYIMTYLPIFVLVIGLLVVIVLWMGGVA